MKKNQYLPIVPKENSADSLQKYCQFSSYPMVMSPHWRGPWQIHDFTKDNLTCHFRWWDKPFLVWPCCKTHRLRTERSIEDAGNTRTPSPDRESLARWRRWVKISCELAQVASSTGAADVYVSTQHTSKTCAGCPYRLFMSTFSKTFVFFLFYYFTCFMRSLFFFVLITRYVQCLI